MITFYAFKFLLRKKCLVTTRTLRLKLISCLFFIYFVHVNKMTLQILTYENNKEKQLLAI